MSPPKFIKRFRNVILCFLLLLSIFLKDYALADEDNHLNRGSFRIAVFKEESFPSIGTPVLLTPEWIYDSLSKHFSVTYLNSSKLSDRKYFNLNNFDLVILPYGEAFPYEAFPAIKEYLFEGGGLLNMAGRPFWVAMEKINGKWEKLDIRDPYKEFLSPLGIKYYEFLDKENIGLTITTSLGFTPLHPTHGNVFPYRIPARDFYFLGKDKGLSPLLIKSWKNPYLKVKNPPKKWSLIGSKGEGHPLNPKNTSAQNILMQIMDFLSFPIILYELETDLAAYHQKERVNLSVKATNTGKTSHNCSVDFEFLDRKGKVVHRKIRFIKLSPNQTKVLNESWHPQEFRSDFYKVTAVLKNNKRVLDKEENGFVVIDGNVLKNGPSIQIKEDQFLINDKISFILGTNYYESKLGELMWLRPNILKIREDFKSMRNLGINFVRVHYHHSKWFRDYFAKVLKEDLDPYFRIADTTALPSERSLRILDAIIQLAQEEGLIFCMDIFSLVPEEMGNPIGWLGLKERILNQDKLAKQTEFIKLLALRYKNVPGITWDLWNEPRLDKADLELLRKWAAQLKKVFRENGDNHPITIGDDLSTDLLDVLDYGCIHTYEPGEFTHMRALGKPVIFQEVWDPAGCGLAEEIRQAEELKKDFNSFLSSRMAGFVPWQWTRQARLWNNASNSEKWDDELGICVHDDGTLKPAGDAYKSLISLIKNKKPCFYGINNGSLF